MDGKINSPPYLGANMKIIRKSPFLGLMCYLAFACSGEIDTVSLPKLPKEPEPGVDVVQLPVVVHIIHNGEEIGTGPNLSEERIQRQIEILNEDFRRKAGTRGHNEHPDGTDSKIEFVLAKSDPESNIFGGINRIDATQWDVENLGNSPNHYAQYIYWDPNKYINVWTVPLAEEMGCIYLGSATGPETDLPGSQLIPIPKEGDAEGLLINWMHFGESNIACHARYGRTLTHEMGHYLGLLHPWGKRDCESNDYCDDTPAVDDAVYGSVPFEGCEGIPIMIGNYMNYSHDVVMNIFTNDQVNRMHYVLKNHLGRNSLMTSMALK